MRYDVRKFLFMGASASKQAFFKAAQEAAIIEFIAPKDRKKHALPQDIENISQAINILRKKAQTQNAQAEQDTNKSLDEAVALAQHILCIHEALKLAEQKADETKQEIKRIMPFGKFSIASLHALHHDTGRRVRFFAAKSTKRLNEIEPALILVSQDDGVDYFVAIQNEPIVFAGLSELYFTQGLEELQKLQKELAIEIEQARKELEAFSAYNLLLHKALISRLNETHLVFAEQASAFELENQLFIVEGWVPATKISALKALCEKFDVYLEETALEPNQTPPTYLQNTGTAKVGEDLIRIFDTPSTHDKDPSLWVLFAFALFFSMIVYDAGYGLVFLLTALTLRLRLKKISSSTKRLLGLMAIVSAACILWGGLTNSFFGIDFSPESAIRKHSLMTWLIEKKTEYTIKTKDDTYQFYVKQYPQLSGEPSTQAFLYAKGPSDISPHPIADKFTDNVLLELSLFLGAIHICIGLIRYIRKNPVGIGWIAFIVGAYLYIPYFLQATSIIHFLFGLDKQLAAEVGMQLMLFGVAFASIAGVIAHGIAGLFECTHAIQLFADVLSYLRIYALGYAGFIVSETVNMLGAKLPFIFAIFVIIFGHLLNMTIAILGGTIHGLRLNFLEWYRYSFFGGGKDFRPLQLMKLEE